MSEPNNEQIVENDLAQTLNVTDGNAAYYAAAKNLVANKGILAYLLKYTMEEFKDILLEEVPQYIEGEPKISEDTEIELLESHVDSVSEKSLLSSRTIGLSFFSPSAPSRMTMTLCRS